jgi:hypothetical protein
VHVPQHRIDYSELTSEHPLFLSISAIKSLYMRARRFNLTISQRAVFAICTESPTRAILPTAASEGYSHEARTKLPCIQHSYTYNTIINDSIRTQNLHLLQKAIHTYTVVIIHLLHEQRIQSIWVWGVYNRIVYSAHTYNDTSSPLSSILVYQCPWFSMCLAMSLCLVLS